MSNKSIPYYDNLSMIIIREHVILFNGRGPHKIPKEGKCIFCLHTNSDKGKGSYGIRKRGAIVHIEHPIKYHAIA